MTNKTFRENIKNTASEYSTYGLNDPTAASVMPLWAADMVFWRSAVTEEIRRAYNNRDNCKLCLTTEEMIVRTFKLRLIFW